MDSSLNYSARMVDLLGPCTGEGGPRAVDARTTLAAWKRPSDAARLPPAGRRDVGAGQYLLGSV
jgi:hypothetical protein